MTEDKGADREDDGIIRGKGAMDGAETLEEAVKMLRRHADILDSFREGGWELTGPVADDYGIIGRAE